MTMDDILYKVSYSNLILLGATLPTYGGERDREDGAIKADEMTEAEITDWMRDANARMR